MADLQSVDLLQAKLQGQWPLKSETKAWALANKWAAFREAEPENIKPKDWEPDRPYVVDPLAGRISETWADMVFGEAPTIVAANDADADRLDEVVEGAAYVDGLQEGEEICSSEGDVWWRIYCDPDAAEHPLLDWRSRAAVIPLFRGTKLRAVAFWSEMDRESNAEAVHRVFEIHAQGVVRNLLYRGSRSSVGTAVPLASHPDTADIPEDDWLHELPILAGRIVNRSGRRRTEGVSDYKRIEGLLYVLNEAVTIGSENARLTLKQRVAIPAKYLDANGKLPSGAEVLIAQNVDENPDAPDAARMAQIEWSFDAEAWGSWHDKMTDTILTRARVAPQLMGRSVGNSPESGSALRSRLLDSVLGASGKGKPWDVTMPQQVCLMQQVDALPIEQGGFGNKWTDPTAAPSVERQSTLPEDATEESERVVLEVTAEILSRRSAIEERHPDWTEDRVLDELERLREEREAATPDFTPFAGEGHDHSGGEVEDADA